MNFQCKHYLCLALPITTLLTVAQAATQAPDQFYVSAESGWTDLSNGFVSPYQRRDKKHFGYRMSMGYLFSMTDKLMLGPETGYGYYGKVTYLNSTGLVAHFESAGWDALANLKYKPNNSINVYLKGGITAIYQQYDIVGPNVTRGGFYQRKFSPTLVAAASCNMTKHTELGLSYTHIFAKSAPLSSKATFTYTNVDEIASINAVMVTVTYHV